MMLLATLASRYQGICWKKIYQNLKLSTWIEIRPLINWVSKTWKILERSSAMWSGKTSSRWYTYRKLVLTLVHLENGDILFGYCIIRKPDEKTRLYFFHAGPSIASCHLPTVASEVPGQRNMCEAGHWVGQVKVKQDTGGLVVNQYFILAMSNRCIYKVWTKFLFNLVMSRYENKSWCS